MSSPREEATAALLESEPEPPRKEWKQWDTRRTRREDAPPESFRQEFGELPPPPEDPEPDL